MVVVNDLTQATLIPTKMTKLNNCVEESKDEKQKGGWSQLPALLLWMIKDLLHIADSARLAFVCKDWESMSLSYPLPAESAGSEQRRQCVPWMMHQRQNPIPCWDFLNLQTKERLTLEAPDHERVAVYFSKRGWLLYQLLNRRDQFVLYNIHTNAKIIMPEAPARYTDTGFLGSFLTLDDEDDSPPYCVVLIPCITWGGKILMASANDTKWKLVEYWGDDPRVIMFPHNIVVHGHKLYTWYCSGGLMSFDVANLLWEKLARDEGEYHSPNTNIRWWLMESEGELVKIDLHKDSNKYRLFKLNDSKTDWMELIQKDQDNRSWVLHHYTGQFGGFCFKESRGKNIYRLINFEDVGPIIHTHDLISGTVQQYKPDQDGIWVDLGWINKMPTSCISAGVVDRVV